MRNSKVYSLLENLDKSEQKSLIKYLHSPYFNSSEDLVVLCQELLKYIHNPPKKELTKEKLWKKLQPNKSFDDVRYRKYISDLYKLTENFLALRNWEKNKLQQKNNLLTSLEDSKIEKLYPSTIKLTNKEFDKFPYRNSEYYYQKFYFESIYYQIMEFDKYRTLKTNHDKQLRYLEIFYLGQKMELICSILIRGFAIKKEKSVFNDEDFDLAIKQIKKYGFDKIPWIGIYYQIYLTLTEPETTDHYYKLLDLFKEYNELFPPFQAYEIYSSAVSYCVIRLNKGEGQFLEEIHKLHKQFLQTNLIHSSIGITSSTFRNMVIIALRLGNYEWTENLIKNYQQFLPEDSRSNAVTYNLATLYFYQKNYDQVIEQLRNVEFEDISYNLNSKNMLLLTYYETDEIEPLFSLFDSFGTYLKRQHELPKNRKEPYQNLIKYTRQLLRVKLGNNKLLVKLKNEVATTKNIASYRWMVEKIAELE